MLARQVHPHEFIRRGLIAPLLLVALLVSPLANLWSGEIVYSFRNADSGGLAAVKIDDDTGRIVASEVRFESQSCRLPKKVRYSSELGLVLVTNESKRGPHVFFHSAGDEKPAGLKLPSVPDELRVFDDRALVTCAEDWLVELDLKSKSIRRSWNVSDTLDPPGNSPQDVLLVPEENLAVVSFQKDSGKGKKQGSRLVIYDLRTMQVRADLLLPRNRPDLHVDGNLKETGPGPEVILLSKRTNTLLATLDLYGAVACLDWTAAQAGRLTAPEYVSTSLDQTWGNAFPDRAILLELDGQEYCLICNAGVDGGVVLMRLSDRRIVWKFDTPPGLERPEFVPELRTAFAACPGKTKQRTTQGITKTYQPTNAIYAVQFAKDRRSGPPVQMEVHPLDQLVFRLIPVETKSRHMLLLAAGLESADTLILYDPVGREIIDTQPAVGIIQQFQLPRPYRAFPLSGAEASE